MSLDKGTHDELRKTSQEIAELLKSADLTPEERQKFESLQPGWLAH